MTKMSANVNLIADIDELFCNHIPMHLDTDVLP